MDEINKVVKKNSQDKNKLSICAWSSYEHMSKKLLIFAAVVVILSLSGCRSAEVYTSDPLSDSTIFAAEGIDNNKIQFI